MAFWDQLELKAGQFRNKNFAKASMAISLPTPELGNAQLDAPIVVMLSQAKARRERAPARRLNVFSAGQRSSARARFTRRCVPIRYRIP